MKKLILFLLIILGFGSSSVYADKDYEYFKTKDGKYYCSEWMTDNKFEPCSNFWIINESDFASLITIGWIFPEFIIIWEKSFCVKDSVEENVSNCNKIKSYKYTDEWTFACTHLDGVESCEKTTREAIDEWIQKNFENAITINWMSLDNYQKSQANSPSESSIIANYFKKKDGIYYCTQWDKTLPSWEWFYYVPCSEINLTSFTGIYLVSSDETKFAKADPVFQATETTWEWSYFSKINELICLNKNAVEDTNCVIEYIERLDGSYSCDFSYIDLNCANYPKIIHMDSGIPSWTWGFIVRKKQGDWSYLSHDTEPGKQVQYSNGKEIWNNSQFSVSSDNSLKQMNNLRDNSARCTLNWKPIDCDEITETTKSLLKAGIWTILIFWILSLVGSIFWLIMLIHSLLNPIPNKILWVAVNIFGLLIGAIIYYFVIKQRYLSYTMSNTNLQQYQINENMTYSKWLVNHAQVNDYWTLNKTEQTTSSSPTTPLSEWFSAMSSTPTTSSVSQNNGL